MGTYPPCSPEDALDILSEINRSPTLMPGSDLWLMIIYVQQLYGDACVLDDGVVGSAGAGIPRPAAYQRNFNGEVV